MPVCKKCGMSLSDAQYLLYNGVVYKSCPGCSKYGNEHYYYLVPDGFGITQKRITSSNPIGIQSHCAKCRSSKKGPFNDALTCTFLYEHGALPINNTSTLIELIESKETDFELALPDEITKSEAPELKEGQKSTITVNAYERNPQARKRCIEYYKCLNNGKVKCEICGFDFGKVYGPAFNGKIHIHHIKELAKIGSEYVIDPEHDLIPICPNCHMVAHSRTPAYTPDDIKKMLENAK